MIVFDLQCSSGHRFEGWFEDAGACEEQASGGLITCPICDNASVARIPSGFAIKTSSEGPPKPDENQKVYFDLWKKMVEYVDRNFDNVGVNFAKEALKIHYGVSEPRNIRGTSSKEEEKTLTEEGVQFHKFPFPARDDSDA
ncbi:DUF1178 family protein [Thermodesulfobacteriota bacterium]